MNSLPTIPTMHLLRTLWLGAVLALGMAVNGQAQEVPAAIREELQRQGVTVEQAQALAREQGYDLTNPEEAIAFARRMGVPEARIQALIERTTAPDQPGTDVQAAPPDTTDQLAEQAVEASVARQDTVREAAIAARKAAAARAELPYFGYDLFDGVPEAFRPNSVGPVDDAYIVGPQDELRLVMWGAAEMQYTLPVDAEGRIYVPNVGQFTVAGRRLSALREDLRLWLSQSYAGLVGEPPTVFMDLTLTRLRPIQVYILGEVARPGGYVLPSNSTVFNALYSVGGPLLRGSLRAVDIIRNGRPVATVDLYEYLLKGYADAEIRLQNNDRVMVRPRVSTIAIRGRVRRPAIYELLPGERFEDLLAFAGGLQPDAYARQFQIDRIIPFAERTDPSVARTVLDFDLQAVLAGEQEVELVDGDEVHIFSIRSAENLAARSRIPAVTVEGAVFKPGRYELTEEVRTVRDLIERADGLTGDAYRDRADLIRLQDDLEPEIIALDLEAVLQGVPTQDLVLRPQDSLVVYSERALRRERTVRISGQVLRPATHPWMENMTVADLLFLGGGLTDEEFLKDVFLNRADLYRRSPDGQTEEIIPFDLGEALAGRGLADTLLRPEDEIRVYPARVERITDRTVSISGAVEAPGTFRFRDNMTLEDLILQAEGFREDAYLAEVEVTRMKLDGQTGEERAVSIKVPLLPGVTALPEEVVRFGVDDDEQALLEARAFPLQHRDRVYVRPRPDFEEQRVVTVRGEVQFPGEYTLLRQNETLSEVVRRAGGILPSGYAGGGRLLRNGEQVVVEMDRALRGNRRYDVILAPGDEIVVPARPNTVAVRGNVGLEGLIKYEPGRRVSYYLDRAGGTLDDTEAVYLTQPSGATLRVKTGWFRATPVVGDGATIRVTRRPPREREPFDLGKTITDVMAIASSAVTLIVVATRAF
ncbi:hypothetical protein AWN76_009220 [Rhodothermaceae bacterium RA]|nr:hypothetical protein AWN76_009220 [Rhodothermaceae bacterium RA]